MVRIASEKLIDVTTFIFIILCICIAQGCSTKEPLVHISTVQTTSPSSTSGEQLTSQSTQQQTTMATTMTQTPTYEKRCYPSSKFEVSIQTSSGGSVYCGESVTFSGINKCSSSVSLFIYGPHLPRTLIGEAAGEEWSYIFDTGQLGDCNSQDTIGTYTVIASALPEDIYAAYDTYSIIIKKPLPPGAPFR